VNAPLPIQDADGGRLLGPPPAPRAVRKAVILAAGRGRRMGRLTQDRPKAALEVGGHALIDWQIAALHAAGVEDIAIVTGHGAQALAGRPAAYIHNPNWAQGTQVESLLCARSWIGEAPAIVSYGDILYHPCAALALIERPGDIVVAYDADHRWLWKTRFGDWLKDSETFRLGPGQVLVEIGGRPHDIDALDGQFMGLMLFTPEGLAQLADRYKTVAADRRAPDFTALLAEIVAAGGRVDTAANLAPWMELDSAKDLRLARKMAVEDGRAGRPALLAFPQDAGVVDLDDGADAPARLSEDIEADMRLPPDAGDLVRPIWTEEILRPFGEIRRHRVESVVAVQNWGRSGSTFVQSLFDDHPQVLSTPNFYSRRFYMVWAYDLAGRPEAERVEAFLEAFRQWWDSSLVDASAGLHRLGAARRELAGVERSKLEGYLRAAFPPGRPVTRRNLFEAAHLAYALARGQRLAETGLQILFPIHGEPRAVACALLEDFPEARFLHTVRDPRTNVASTLAHYKVNNFDLRFDPVEATLLALFGQQMRRYGRLHTAFADRPYLPYLAVDDRARLLRLEELHGAGRTLLDAVCAWLGLEWSDRLLDSTWDGKPWWNRPESGAESVLGGQDLTRNIPNRLSALDLLRIDVLSQCASPIDPLYRRSPAPGARLKLYATLALPWRDERRARPSAYRGLFALLQIGRFLPRRLAAPLQDAAQREQKRQQLVEMAAGATAVRKTIAVEQRCSAVTALLLLSPRTAGWRARALVQMQTPDAMRSDRISVAFLDQMTRPSRAIDHLFGLAVLGLGWPAARAAAFIRVRILMRRLARTGPAPFAARVTELTF
jgi:choline kinase